MQDVQGLITMSGNMYCTRNMGSIVYRSLVGELSVLTGIIQPVCAETPALLPSWRSSGY